eukprot:12628339-Ditylum_brightwellii.AAC.1
MSGALTLVLRNATLVCRSGLARLHKKRSFATTWWKNCTSSSSSFLASLLTSWRWFAAGSQPPLRILQGGRPISS